MFLVGHLKGCLIGLGLEIPSGNGILLCCLIIMLEIGFLLVTGHFVPMKCVATFFNKSVVLLAIHFFHYTSDIGPLC
jgi:hypothetical protein